MEVQNLIENIDRELNSIADFIESSGYDIKDKKFRIQYFKNLSKRYTSSNLKNYNFEHIQLVLEEILRHYDHIKMFFLYDKPLLEQLDVKYSNLSNYRKELGEFILSSDKSQITE